jgi:tetratricopeptide (TPR) repeat protein
MSRYLLESGAWSEEIELMKAAWDICDDKQGLDFAHLCNTHGCIETERGNTDKSLGYLDTAIGIRRRLLGDDHIELAHSYNNYANAILQAYATPHAAEDAIVFYLKAIVITNKQPEEQRLKVEYVWYLNISRAYLVLGQLDVALQYVDLGEKSVFSFFEPGSFLDGV